MKPDTMTLGQFLKHGPHLILTTARILLAHLRDRPDAHEARYDAGRPFRDARREEAESLVLALAPFGPKHTEPRVDVGVRATGGMHTVPPETVAAIEKGMERLFGGAPRVAIHPDESSVDLITDRRVPRYSMAEPGRASVIARLTNCIVHREECGKAHDILDGVAAYIAKVERLLVACAAGATLSEEEGKLLAEIRRATDFPVHEPERPIDPSPEKMREFAKKLLDAAISGDRLAAEEVLRILDKAVDDAPGLNNHARRLLRFEPTGVIPLAVEGFPRRSRVDLNEPAELAIRAAMNAVEAAGGSERLTDAVTLLGYALDHVADHIESQPGAEERVKARICANAQAGHENPAETVNAQWPAHSGPMRVDPVPMPEPFGGRSILDGNSPD